MSVTISNPNFQLSIVCSVCSIVTVSQAPLGDSMAFEEFMILGKHNPTAHKIRLFFLIKFCSWGDRLKRKWLGLWHLVPARARKKGREVEKSIRSGQEKSRTFYHLWVGGWEIIFGRRVYQFCCYTPIIYLELTNPGIDLEKYVSSGKRSNQASSNCSGLPQPLNLA